MGLNCNRGFNRIYVLLAAAWVLWGLYKPVADHKREIKEVIEIANRDVQQCEQSNAPLQKEYDREMEEWARFGGPKPDRPRLEDCYPRWAANELNTVQRLKVSDYYWNMGSPRLAAYCVLPPVLAYLMLVGSLRLVTWVARGFKQGVARR